MQVKAFWGSPCSHVDGTTPVAAVVAEKLFKEKLIAFINCCVGGKRHFLLLLVFSLLTLFSGMIYSGIFLSGSRMKQKTRIMMTNDVQWNEIYVRNGIWGFGYCGKLIRQTASCCLVHISLMYNGFWTKINFPSIN